MGELQIFGGDLVEKVENQSGLINRDQTRKKNIMGERVLYPKGEGKLFKTTMYKINKLQGCIVRHQGIWPIFSKTLNGV